MLQVSASPISGSGIQVQCVSRVFAGNAVALDALDLTIEPGEFTAILGPSGCGKSTLLRLIAGLDKATHGAVEISGHSHTKTTDIAYVFQDAHLLPWRNV